MDFFNHYYEVFNNLIKTNQVFAGLFSVWGLSVVTYLLRNIPMSIWQFTSTQLTTNIHINNDTYDTSNLEVFNSFLSWYNGLKYKKYSRNLTVYACEGNGKTETSIGYGLHFFIYKNTLFWFRKKKEDGNQSTKVKEEIVITALTRDHSKLINLISQFVQTNENSLNVFKLNRHEEWYLIKNVSKRNLDNVIIDSNIKTKLTDAIDDFISEEDWYKQRSISYKLAFVLEGPPGTGKTSLVKALASHYDKDVYDINISTVSDETFANAITEVPKNSFILIEDFDSTPAVQERTSTGESSNEENGVKTVKSKLSLTTILNTIDGIVSLNGVVIFLSTNVINKIDTAMIRPGRIDYVVNIPFLTDKEIKEYIKLMFPIEAVDLDQYTFKDMAGCDVEKVYLCNKRDYKGFVSDLLVYERDSY